MDNLLLIISCSSRKVPSYRAMPAIERYYGPHYQSLKKLKSDGKIPPTLDIKIISAKYGLIDANFEIENYDRRMTADRAIELQQEIMEDLKHLTDIKSYSEIFVNLGKDYLPAIEGFEKITGKTPIYATGGIGLKRKQMINWILSHNCM